MVKAIKCSAPLLMVILTSHLIFQCIRSAAHAGGSSMWGCLSHSGTVPTYEPHVIFGETYSLPPCCTLYDTLHSNFPDFRHWDVNEWKNATYSYKQVAVCSITGSAHRCQHRWSRKNHLFPPSRLLQYKVINMSYLIGPFVSLLNCLYSANDHWSSSVSPGWGAVPPLTPSNTHFY